MSWRLWLIWIPIYLSLVISCAPQNGAGNGDTYVGPDGFTNDELFQLLQSDIPSNVVNELDRIRSNFEQSGTFPDELEENQEHWEDLIEITPELVNLVRSKEIKFEVREHSTFPTGTTDMADSLPAGVLLDAIGIPVKKVIFILPRLRYYSEFSLTWILTHELFHIVYKDPDTERKFTEMGKLVAHQIEAQGKSGSGTSGAEPGQNAAAAFTRLNVWNPFP